MEINQGRWEAAKVSRGIWHLEGGLLASGMEPPVSQREAGLICLQGSLFTCEGHRGINVYFITAAFARGGGLH